MTCADRVFGVSHGAGVRPNLDEGIRKGRLETVVFDMDFEG